NVERPLTVARRHLHFLSMLAHEFHSIVRRQWRDARPIEQLAYEFALFGREDLIGIAHIVERRESSRKYDIDAIGLSLNMLVDPFQGNFKLIGRHPGGAKDAHAPCSRSFDDDVTAVRECENGQVDSKHLCDGCLHHWRNPRTEPCSSP